MGAERESCIRRELFFKNDIQFEKFIFLFSAITLLTKAETTEDSLLRNLVVER